MGNRRKKERTKIMIGRIALVLACITIVFVYYWSWYVKKQQEKIELKSRYTFTVTMDSDEETRIEKVADKWLEEFLNQFTQKYVSRSKALYSVKRNDTVVLDKDSNTVLVSFSVKLKDSDSEYFSAWDGVLNDDRFQFEWVISYEIEDHYDDTITAYVSQILSSEEYGISQYNQGLNQDGKGDIEVATSATKSLASYEIKNDTLYVTYDGEKKVTVPVDCANLPMVSENASENEAGAVTTETTSENKLKTGSYQISTEMTAFLYGGTTIGGKKIPLTLCYSKDKGLNWTTCEIDTIYNADYYYINFVDDKDGVIVCGYDRNDTISESSRIYMTFDGGETWNQTGSGPATNIIKGVIFIDKSIGYFCYNYVDGMDSNLYVTRDGGETFSKVVMEAQELDSTAANSSTEATTAASTSSETGTSTETSETKLEWKDVYKEALVPIYDDNGVLTIYLTQGSKGVYNSGKTAAKYMSYDKGQTWKYIGQLEITSESNSK